VRKETNGHIAAATNTALDLAVGEFVALLDHDDLLSETALYEIAVELDAHPDADVIYSDSDSIDDAGRRSEPYFKTDWNPDLMLGYNIVNHLGAYRRSLVEEVGRLRVGFEGGKDYDLMLRAAEASAPSRIRHIPAVLYHWRRNASSPSCSEASMERCVVAARRAVRQHLERTGVQAHVEPAPGVPIWTRVIYLLPRERPLVSIIVPTRDRADFLACCADGVLKRTDYEPLELVIVDNDSVEAETQGLYA
jgi:glycosyltransferase involved in cell wall biosynthesis